MNGAAGFITASRQALLVVSAIAWIASVAHAQTTYRLAVFTSAGGYLGTAQVTSTPAGIDCRSESSGNLPNVGTCSAQFPAGTTVTLTATPLYGGTLDGWVGACAGQGATCQIAMTGALQTSPRTIAKTYTLTIRGTGNASGLVGSRDDFAHPRISCGIGPGGVTGGTCVTEFPANQTVWLYREDGDQYARFAGYSGCGGDPGECRFVMDGPRTVTAGWIAMEIIIGAGPGNGTGKVSGVATNSPVGAFDCTITPTSATGACSAIWDRWLPPMSITLTATPTGNSVFVAWMGKCSGTGASCVIPIEIDTLRVTALFEIPLYALSVTGAGSGNGTVVSAPTRINCAITAGATGHDCSEPFPKGTEVTLTADPTGGSTFGGWSGACSGTQSTCVVTVSSASQATARFVAPRPASELALALLGGLTLSTAEQRELDRFGNNDGTFNLGDLLALLSRTGEQLPAATMNAVLQTQRGNAARRGDGRTP